MGHCRICKSDTSHGYRRSRKPWLSESAPFAYVCDKCKPLALRKFNKKRGKTGRTVQVPKFHEWLTVLDKAWDQDGQCFRCQISGVTLCIDDRSSPAYATLEHADNGEYMVVAAIINDMKSDLTLDEFKKIVKELACHFNGRSVCGLQSLLGSLRNFRRY